MVLSPVIGYHYTQDDRKSKPTTREKKGNNVKNYYEKELLINSTFADRACVMGVYQATLLIQDAMTEFFHQYGCDAVRLSKSHNVVWAVARTKIRFDRHPFWMERVRVRAFPVKLTPIAVHLNVLVETLEGEPLIRCRQELCVIDSEDHSLRRVDSTPFPLDMGVSDPVLPDPCRRMKLDLGEEKKVLSHTVRTTDTDMNHHTNNAAYIRLVCDCLPSDFWDRKQIREFDVQYVNESVEGETLDAYLDLEEDAGAVQMKRGDKTLIKSYFLLGPAVSLL